MGAAAVAAELRFPIQLSGKQFGFLSLGGTGYVFGSREEPDQWSLPKLQYHLTSVASSAQSFQALAKPLPSLDL